MFVCYHLNPCHPSIFTFTLIMYPYFKASSPISVQECCFTHPALVCSLFLCRVASLSFCSISPLPSDFLDLSMMISYAYLLNYHLFHLDLRMVFTYPALGCIFSLIDYNPCLNSILYCACIPILHILFFSSSFDDLRD